MNEIITLSVLKANLMSLPGLSASEPLEKPPSNQAK